MAKSTIYQYEISSKCVGKKSASWQNHDEDTSYRHHKIKVVNTITGTKTSFDFWASIAQPKVLKDDLPECFYCFLSDASSGLQNFDDFCSEFGYDNDSIKAYKTWKSCKKIAKKATKVIDGNIDSVYDLLDKLNEDFNL